MANFENGTIGVETVFGRRWHCMTYVPLAKRSCDDDDDDDDETGYVRPTMTNKWMFVAFDFVCVN